MTIENYEQHVAKGLAGPGTSTCHPSAFDCVSDRHSVSTDTYTAFNDFFESPDPNQPTYRELQRRLYRELGCSSLRGVSYKSVRDAEGFADLLGRYRQGGRRVGIWTGPDHLVGLRPATTGETCRLVGLVPPDTPDEPMLPEDIFYEYLEIDRRRGGDNWDNVMSISAEPRERFA